MSKNNNRISYTHLNERQLRVALEELAIAPGAVEEAFTQAVDREMAQIAEKFGLGGEVSSASNRPTKSGDDTEAGSGSNGSTRKVGKKARRPQPGLTPEQIASRKVQGQYLGRIRQVPKTRRGQFQQIAKSVSREAAIKAIDKFLAAR